MSIEKSVFLFGIWQLKKVDVQIVNSLDELTENGKISRHKKGEKSFVKGFVGQKYRY